MILRTLHIRKISEPFPFFSEIFRIEILDKIVILRMRFFETGCVFDRAPVSFCSSCNFCCVAHQVVKIAAIETIKFFEPVEIRKTCTIKDKIVTRVYTWNVIEAKRYQMIYFQSNMKNDGRNNHAINKRHADEMGETNWEECFE